MLFGLVMLAMCSLGAIWFGGRWYSAWWDVSWVPMPPLCRFVLQHRLVGYHLVRDEMIFWSFLACTTLVLLFRLLLQRTQNKVTGAKAGGPRQFRVRTHWAARFAQFYRSLGLPSNARFLL
jgi:hypothetical protein